MASLEAGWSEGAELHRRVDRHKWCVTRSDLAAFRRLVRKAVSTGEIRPTALDDFDPADRTIGPNLYTVNEQLVKPTTAAAGGMSWALMLHPEGLTCDLFVTHAWQEGVYELIDRVLYSWPRGARHAYICVLANPQNLDIGGLIGEPRESPFARSLAIAKWMLVVPNQRGSIYQRMWCAYEAYLAYTADKTILVARVPCSRQAMLLAAVYVSAAVLIGLAVGWLRAHVIRAGLTRAENVAFYPAVILPYMGSAIFSSRWLPGVRRACHYCGAAWFGYFFATSWMRNDHFSFVEEADAIRMRATLLAGVCYFVIAEVDTMRSTLAYAESCQLRQGYSGSIMDASCAVQRDADYILREIGGKAGEVDHAIQVLIRAGLWSRSMRMASAVGVDLKDASHINFATPCTMWAVQLMLDSMLISMADRWNKSLGFANFALQALWVAVLMWKPPHTRAFGIRAITVLSTVFCSLATTIHVVVVHVLARAESHAAPLWQAYGALGLAFQLFGVAVLLAGVGHVAQWPLCGRCLAQSLLMAADCSCVRRRQRLRTEGQGGGPPVCEPSPERQGDTGAASGQAPPPKPSVSDACAEEIAL